MKKYIAPFILSILLITNASTTVFAVNQTIIDNATEYLKSQQKDDGHIEGFSGVSDWAAMAFVASGSDIAKIKTSDGKTLLQYFQLNPPTQSSSANDWAKRILTVSAANQEPSNFSGINLVDGLKTHYNNNQLGSTTADNDDMFGLLALMAAKENPTNTIVTDTTTFVISYQHADGGFSYATDASVGSDNDDTAAAIMALVAAKNAGVSVNNLQTAIDNAKAYILSHQNADGGFAYDPNPATSWDTSSNVSTTAWVVMAFSSLGMQSDNRFNNAQNYIASTQESNGSFPYQGAYPPGDTFDTSFALLALTGNFWPIASVSPTPSNSNPASTTITPKPTTDAPTPTTSQVVRIADTIPTSTPSPTQTPNTTPNITIASTPKPSQKTIIAETTNDINEPTNKPENTPKSKPSVLGAKNHTIVKTNQWNIPLNTKIFALCGLLFLFLHFGKIIFFRQWKFQNTF